MRALLGYIQASCLWKMKKKRRNKQTNMNGHSCKSMYVLYSTSLQQHFQFGRFKQMNEIWTINSRKTNGMKCRSFTHWLQSNEFASIWQFFSTFFLLCTGTVCIQSTGMHSQLENQMVLNKNVYVTQSQGSKLWFARMQQQQILQ